MMHKKERSVVGQTNRTPSISPRRGAPPGGSLTATLLASVRDCETTTSSKHCQSLSVSGKSPRVANTAAQSAGCSAASQPPSPIAADAQERAAVFLSSSPRRDSTDVVNGSRSGSLVRGVSDAARMHGMRALLFDALDTSGVVQPPIPDPPQANTRFSAVVTRNTFPIVQPKQGSATFADAKTQFHSKGACHLDALLCNEDKASAAKVASARASHARALQEHQGQCLIESQIKMVHQDRARIAAKSTQQQVYAAKLKEKGS